MVNVEPEGCIPWNTAQAEDRLKELEENLVDLRPILERFTPDHIHWQHGGVPFPFRLVPEVFRELMPVTDSVFKLALEIFLKMNAFPGRLSYGVYFPDQDSPLWPTERALRFREIDFRVLTKRVDSWYGKEIISDSDFFINTTRVIGSESIYQMFPSQYRNHDYFIYGQGQEFINALLAARV